jgi:dTDP-4-amino-4,6-dideoxy-D-galactose acyltransferase
VSSTRSELWQIHEWETAFFGVATARITVPRINAADLNRVLAECQVCGVRVVHYLADANDDESIRAAEQAGFHLVDVRMTLEWNASMESGVTQTDLVLRDYRVGDLPRLEEIARTIYRQTRYYYDRHYPRERCNDLYAVWIAKSCQGDADRVIVAEQDNIIVGFITCQLSPDKSEGTIGLVGVSAEARGLGVGRAIVGEAQRWFATVGVRRVRVVTQIRNIAALALYQRCGFVVNNVGFWYHKWF